MSDRFNPVPGDGDWRYNLVIPARENEATAAHGFAMAGRIVVQQWLEGRTNDLLLLPIVYLYRHALELALKAGILEASRRLIADGITDEELLEPSVRKWLQLTASHRLAVLADRLEYLLNQLDLEALPPETHRVLRQLHALDPAGDTFRYPTTWDRRSGTHVPNPRPSATHIRYRVPRKRLGRVLLHPCRRRTGRPRRI